MTKDELNSAPESFKRCLPGAKPLPTPEQTAMAFCEASEKELHQQFKNWCAINGVIAVSARMDKKSGIGNGVFDFHVMRGGYGCAIEFKAGANGLDPDQKVYLNRLTDAQVPYWVAYDLTTAIQFIKTYLHI